MRDGDKKSYVWLLVEGLLWFFPSCIFISLFLYKYEGSAEGALLHLEVVGVLLLLVTCLRCVCHRWLHLRPAALIGAIAYSGALVLLSGYYAAALISLDGWGRLISWALVVAYASQADFLLESLGLQADLVYVVLLFAFLSLAAFFHVKILCRDGLKNFVEGMSRGLFLGLVGAVFLVSGLFFWRFYEFPMAEKGEPLSVTFFPEEVGEKLQSHFKFHSKTLNDAEESSRRSYVPNSLKNPANVIFIVVDALRADHLSINGYSRETTPYMRELLSSEKWRNLGKIHSVCAESTCGLMALASSRNVHMFVDKPITIQEILRKNGYGTHMMLGGDHTNFYGLRKAYGVVDSYFDASMSVKRYINDDAAVVDKLDNFPSFDGKPVFIQFHLMSAHGLGTRENDLAPFQPSRSYYGDLAGRALRRGEGRVREYVNYYDNGVHGADQKIKSLIGLLELKGYLRDAIVVVTADHGEYIGEAGVYGHAKGVGEPVLGIPMLIGRYGPTGFSGEFESRAMSQVDIAPTVLHEIGIAIPTAWEGTPVQVRDRRVAYFQQNKAFGLIEKKADGVLWKYWVDAGTGQEYAYLISSDPEELSNLGGQIDPIERSQWRRRLIDMEVNARQSIEAKH